MKHRRLVLLTRVALFLPFLLAACDDKRRHQASDSVSLADVQSPVSADATPSEVAKAMLSALRDAQNARALGLGSASSKKAYDNALGRLRALTAAKDVQEQIIATKSLTIARDISQDAAVTLVNEAWISQFAHYEAGILLATLRVTPDNPQTDALAQVDAENPREREMLMQFEADLQKSPPVDALGKPAPSVSPAYQEALRTKTLAAGFNVPITAMLEIRMRKVDNAWRVTKAGLASPLSRPKALASRPTVSQPAFSTTLPTTGS